jgi:sugar phosphate isomerase/epimerase
MKTSGHKSDELKNKKKGGGPQIGYLWDFKHAWYFDRT